MTVSIYIPPLSKKKMDVYNVKCRNNGSEILMLNIKTPVSSVSAVKTRLRRAAGTHAPAG